MNRLPISLIALAFAAAPAWSATPAKAPAQLAPRPGPLVRPPSDPIPGLLDQARDAQSKGDTELALRLAQSAIVADPARPGSYIALGDLYAQQGQADYARSFYDQALVIDPVEPSALKAIAALGSKAVATTAP